MSAKKHAYLIIAHSNPYILVRLLTMLDDPRNDIFLHIDKKSTNLKPDRLRRYVKRAGFTLVKPISVYWGHSSQVDCEMILLKACVKKDDYEYVHLISGNDLPIKSQDYIHSFFEQIGSRQFLQVGDTEPYLYRLKDYHFLVKYQNNRKKWMKLIDSASDYIRNHFTIDRLKKCGDIDIVKTANWFSVTGECAEYIVSKEKFIKKLTRHTVCADEMFLGTVIWNSKFKNQVYNPEQSWDGHMRYIDRIRHVGSSPHTFTMEDKESIDSSEMLFARKFDEKVDEEIIDYVYEKYK